jgi:hypothetical protein
MKRRGRALRVRYGHGVSKKIPLNSYEKAQMKLARATLKMSDEAVRARGGMSKADARFTIEILGGKVPKGHARSTERAGLADRLFAGVYPGGISYADRAREEHGDYAKVAFLPFDTLELVIYKPKSPLLPLVREDAAKIIARRGEQFQVSASGQHVKLGR